ncbi:MAG: tetratricopeptide repeat protein [Betaproteobacteria bacterium]|nr:tetratricopeptide repeat protein [Betaproteobacteria bacterium]
MLRRLLANALIASGARAERSGNLGLAGRRYRAAVAVAPRYARAHLNLGAALEADGDASGALAAYHAALGAEADNPFAHYNVGRLHHARGATDAAEAHLRRALQRKPDFADALIALANVLDARRDATGAAALLRQALALAPSDGGAWFNYGELLWRLARYDEAEDALRRTLEIEPRFIPAWHLLGNLLRGTSRLAESLEALAAARRLEPARFDLESMELLTLTLSDALSAEALFERQRGFGARLEAAVPARRAAHAQSADPERRLRIGYVSCDFNRHPVAWFVLPLLERHDRAGYEPICYFTGDKVDEVTARVRGAASGWRDATALTDAQLAQQVAQDGIDVLVDLTGHAGALRLGAFAQQPAPVQASWLGYLGSTGLARIQYRLSDARADPPGAADRLHTEKLVRLPHSLWCYRPVHDEPHAPEPPLRARGFTTFGSFNHAPKLSAAARRLWAQILRGAPGARLLIVGFPEGRARSALLREFADAGIDGSRLTVLPRVSFGEYLREFDAVDLALDSLPYGGGTTTFDTLWMGVPVLTLAGERSAGRSSASILGALDLHDWVATTPEDYVRLALAHAADGARLAALRASLRARLRASPLMDEAGFTRDLEDAYRMMWRTWCAQRIT